MKQIILKSGRKLNVFSIHELWRVTGYDHAIASCQATNCGYYFVDAQFNDVLDNEFDLAECYEIIAEMKAKNVL